MKKALSIILCAILFLDVVSLCLMAFLHGDSQNTVQYSVTGENALFSKVKITAVGDNLVTKTVYESAVARAGDDYDFAPVYENTGSAISSADIAVLNQETLISTIHNISGTDLYNSPTALGDEMVKLGFDLINMGNDHVLDFGEAGLNSALDFWSGKGVKTIGVMPDKNNMDSATVCEVNGVRIAFISITSSLGNNNLPTESTSKILLTSEESYIQQMIAGAQSKADCVVVLAHWGTEYSLQPDEDVKQLAEKMSDWGADVIIGSGTHTLQSTEYIINNDNSRTLVAYSLGNFISSSEKAAQLLGGMLSFTVTKNNNTGDTVIEEVKLEGVVTHYGYEETGVRLYRLSDYSDETAKRHGAAKSDPDFSLTNLKSSLQNCCNF